MTPIEQFRALAIAAGAKDLPQVLASGRLAVKYGDKPSEVLAALQRNRPEMFLEQRKARYHTRSVSKDGNIVL